MTRLTVWGVTLAHEFAGGDDLGALLLEAEPGLEAGDVVVVTSKVVSKAEGRVVLVSGDRETARRQAIEDETVRVVATRGQTRIVETRQGLVLAAAGVDTSNTAPGTLVLLPLDADASARALRDRIAELAGIRVAVVVSDTMGRAWRRGLTDQAVGAAGIAAIRDYRGRTDDYGNDLAVTEMADADQLAGAAELVKGKLDGTPFAVIRGLAYDDNDDGARVLVRPAGEDLFRLGTAEAFEAGRQDALREGAP
ncbi:MAG: dehydro coenzyme reductase / coenzyme F420-0:L-glutamate ligase / coenzyme [Frankiales bacterium]|jgi:coenzyme F420-0:L-glutamate ligase/coenzyme F420-1:gamma-L-glutamate ligase|nr:dehydro coenzyme reductase / coenzyme F420-0:L-glutamate ligase / coenzyme [Frankiales bacterium]MDX6221731.1 dehydro coenzyme reductase / coenzyme F420-0:L-glutamate ligase / coenzyme [Frankiales bacterium]